MSDLYANFPLQSAILTCGVKAHVADGIAQVRSETDRLEFRRNLAYVLYGGIFVGGMCHLEYDYIFPALFGNDHSITTIFEEVIFDNFISAPLFWLPPAYLVKAAVYDYPMREGLEKYVHDIKHNGLLTKYLSIWIPAQSISFSVIPGELHPAVIFSLFLYCVPLIQYLHIFFIHIISQNFQQNIWELYSWLVLASFGSFSSLQLLRVRLMKIMRAVRRGMWEANQNYQHHV